MDKAVTTQSAYMKLLGPQLRPDMPMGMPSNFALALQLPLESKMFSITEIFLQPIDGDT